MFARARAARQLGRGTAAASSGDPAAARRHYDAALRTARLGGAWLVAGEAALRLGDLAGTTHDLGAAEHHYRLGATQYRRAPRSVESLRGRVECLEKLGDVLLQNARPWDAYRVFQEGAAAAGLAPDGGVPGSTTDPGHDAPGDVDAATLVMTGEALQWTSHLATAALAAGRHRLADEHYERVLSGCRLRRDVAGQIACWKGLARLARERLRWDDAAHALSKASNLYSELPAPEQHTAEWIACLRELGLAHKQLGRRQEQIRAFKLAARLEQVAAQQPR